MNWSQRSGAPMRHDASAHASTPWNEASSVGPPWSIGAARTVGRCRQPGGPDVCRWWLQARPHQLVENSRQLRGPRELADVGVLRGSQAAGQAIVLTTRCVDDEFHRQCRPPSGRCVATIAPARCARTRDLPSEPPRVSTQLLNPAASGAQGADRRFAVTGLP
jgi:hypothetical protein